MRNAGEIEKTRMKLADELFSSIKPPYKYKRPSRSHLQTGVLLPSIVSFHLS